MITYNYIIIAFFIGLLTGQISLKQVENFNVQSECKAVPTKVTDGIKKIMTGITKPVEKAFKKVGNEVSDKLGNIKEKITKKTLEKLTEEISNSFNLIKTTINKILNHYPFLKFFLFFLPVFSVLVIISPFLAIMAIMGLLFGWTGIFITLAFIGGFIGWFVYSLIKVKNQLSKLIEEIVKILPFSKIFSVFEPLSQIPDELKKIFGNINIIPDLKLAENIGNVFKTIFDVICSAIAGIDEALNTTKKGIQTTINTGVINPINGLVRAMGPLKKFGVNVNEIKKVKF